MVLAAAKYDCGGSYGRCISPCKASVPGHIIARFSNKIRLVTSESCYLEVMDMFMALTVAMVSWIYTHFQTHQVVYIKYVQLSVCQSQ